MWSRSSWTYFEFCRALFVYLFQYKGVHFVPKSVVADHSMAISLWNHLHMAYYNNFDLLATSEPMCKEIQSCMSYNKHQGMPTVGVYPYPFPVSLTQNECTHSTKRQLLICNTGVQYCVKSTLLSGLMHFISTGSTGWVGWFIDTSEHVGVLANNNMLKSAQHIQKTHRDQACKEHCESTCVCCYHSKCSSEYKDA